MTRNRKIFRTLAMLSGGVVCLQLGACASMLGAASLGDLALQILAPIALQLASEFLLGAINGGLTTGQVVNTGL